MATITILISDTDEPGVPFNVKVLRDRVEEASLDKPTPAERVARAVEARLIELKIQRAVKVNAKNKKPIKKKSSRRNR